MENFHHLIKLLAFSLLTAFVLSVSAFTRPDKYFLNYGLSSNATKDSRSFVGDDQDPDSSGFKVLPSKTNLVEDTTNGYNDPLYRTAKVISSISCYRFNIPEKGTYIVRFHFYAFSASASSSPPLTSAKFNVSASGHLLISNFNATAAANGPVIEEFVLTINEGELKIFFYSDKKQSSSNNVAFVNAIEVFLTTLDLQDRSCNTLITSRGKGPAFGSPNDEVLRPIHRINFGDQEVVPSGDFFWRTWSVDNAFLLTHGSAINKTLNGDISHSAHGTATVYDAPDEVYRTARVKLNTTSSEAADFPKSTWTFNVSISLFPYSSESY